MSDIQKSDEAKFNETLKRMLKTPPKPHDKPQSDKPHASQQSDKEKPDGPPAKKDHPGKR
ncbi:hypothetical protein [Mesorhizobium sp. BR1-1-7]|uniref:hypothetical protein n=1 Tax=Mesorhizobium sp. BR1-1-7 TaxID=2876647 RepID=UPI001CCDC177|nr:hypothetical protein [Mesorhizobium sp. BR1-1-7]